MPAKRSSRSTDKRTPVHYLFGSHVRLTFTFSLLLMLGGLVYFPGISGPFLFDDLPNILSNTFVHIQSLETDSLYHAAYSSAVGPLNRPIAMLSFALNSYFASGASDATIFKATNVALHVVNGLLIFWLLCLILPKVTTRYRNKSAVTLDAHILLAGTVALLWLVHPIQLTSVLYVVQRMASLAALFTLLGIICFIKGRLWVISGRAGGLWLMTLGPTGFGLLGLLSKETTLLLPVFMLLLEVYMFRGEKPWTSWQKLAPRTRRILSSFIVLGFIAVLIAVIEHAVHGYGNRDFTFVERVLTEPRVLWFYIFLILVPRINEFALYHDDIPLSTSLTTPWTTLPALLALMALLAIAVAWRRKRPLVSFGILWFFTGHLLESTVFALEIAHEHRNYLASIGVLLIIAGFIAEISHKLGHARVWTILPVLGLIFGGVTFLRSTQWSDFDNLARYEALHHPDSASTQANLGISLFYQGQYSAAMQAMRRASELDGNEQLYLLNMHLISAKTGTPLTPEDEFETIRRLTANKISPSTSLAFESINACILSSCRSLQKPLESWSKLLLEVLPPTADRSFYYHVHGRALAGQGKNRDAINAFRRSFQLDPNYLHPLFEIVRIHIRLKDVDKAEKALALLKKANIGNLHPRDAEIEALAKDVEKMRLGVKSGHL